MANIPEYLAVGCSLLGLILNARKIRAGFIAWGIGNIFWVIVALQKEMWGLLACAACYLATEIYGYWYWGKDGKKT